MPRLALIFCFLVSTWIAYLYKGAVDARWAINLAGGSSVIDSQKEILRDDENFMRSIKVNPSKSDYHSIDKITLCTEISTDCIDKALSKTNFITISTGNGKPSTGLLNAYLKEGGYSELGCQAKHEISRVITENSYLLGREENHEKATKLIEKIKSNGGLDFSLDSKLCRKYFSERPYLARAYLYHLSILLGIAQGKYSSEWIYLYYKAVFSEA